MAHQQIDYRLSKSPRSDSSHSTAKRRQIESEFRQRLNRHIEADLPATLTWRDGRAMRRERVRVLRMVGRSVRVLEHRGLVHGEFAEDDNRRVEWNLVKK